MDKLAQSKDKTRHAVQLANGSMLLPDYQIDNLSSPNISILVLDKYNTQVPQRRVHKKKLCLATSNVPQPC